MADAHMTLLWYGLVSMFSNSQRSDFPQPCGENSMRQCDRGGCHWLSFFNTVPVFGPDGNYIALLHMFTDQTPLP